MGGNVDNVISPCHDVDVSFLIHVAGITSVNPLALEAQQVTLVESLVILPKRPKRSRCQWKTQNDVARTSPGNLIAFVIHDSGCCVSISLIDKFWMTGVGRNGDTYLTSNPGMAFPALPGLIGSGG